MSRSLKRWILAAGVGSSMLVGGAIGSAMFGAAPAIGQTATDTATESAPAAGADRPARDPSMGGHMANGITESLLTGDTAAKVAAAANEAVAGGTIERVENDAEGAAYEAHMTKADGSRVTVKIGEDFKVIEIEEGGPHR
jgi:hypothetical protein